MSVEVEGYGDRARAETARLYEVPEMIGQLHAVTEMLEADLKELEHRLMPVLREELDIPMRSEAVREAIGSPLARELQSANERVIVIQARLRSMLNRLEV